MYIYIVLKITHYGVTCSLYLTLPIDDSSWHVGHIVYQKVQHCGQVVKWPFTVFPLGCEGTHINNISRAHANANLEGTDVSHTRRNTKNRHSTASIPKTTLHTPKFMHTGTTENYRDQWVHICEIKIFEMLKTRKLMFKYVQYNLVNYIRNNWQDYLTVHSCSHWNPGRNMPWLLHQCPSKDCIPALLKKCFQ